MSAEQYLRWLLAEQDLSEGEFNTLRSLRDEIQQKLSVLQGGPRFYYAGSFGKKTIIRQRYDLDIVMYWPSTVTYTIKGIYDAVGTVLKKNWSYVNAPTSSPPSPPLDGQSGGWRGC